MTSKIQYNKYRQGENNIEVNIKWKHYKENCTDFLYNFAQKVEKTYKITNASHEL